MTTRAVIYSRVSVGKDHDEEQDNSDSIENQIAVLVTMAATNGYQLVAPAKTYFDDGLSGFKGGERPGFTQLLVDISKDKFDRILVRHLDRLERNESDATKLRVACARYGVKLQTGDGMLIDPTTASGGFTAKVFSAFGQLESDIKSERLRAHFAGAAAKGEIQAPKGTYGYDDADRSKIVPEEAARIAAAYRAVDREITVGSIVREWNDAGVPQRKGGSRWTHAHLNSILRRPRNAGIVAHNGVVLEGVVGRWETIIDADTYHRVVARLNKPERRTNHSGYTPKYLASGLAHCGTCGAVMRSNTATDKRAGTRYPALRCTSQIGKTSDGSKHSSARVVELDHLVQEEMLAAFMYGLPEEVLPPQEEHDIQGLLSAQAALSASRQEVLELRSDDLISKAEGRIRLVAIKEKSDDIDGQLEHARATSSRAHMTLDLRREVLQRGRADVNGIIMLKDGLAERFAALHIEQRRDLVSQFLDVVVNPGRGSGPEKYVITHKVVTSLNPVEEP
jgi:site-specific DNA recombinase